MGLIITRGFGTDIIIIYKSVAVCKPEIETKELRPVMKAERPPRVCKDEGEE